MVFVAVLFVAVVFVAVLFVAVLFVAVVVLVVGGVVGVLVIFCVVDIDGMISCWLEYIVTGKQIGRAHV